MVVNQALESILDAQYSALGLHISPAPNVQQAATYEALLLLQATYIHHIVDSTFQVTDQNSVGV